MDEARSMLPYLKSIEDKYNVLYVNTPWNSMDMSTLERFPAEAITPDDAALFMWVDSYTVAKAAGLLEKWGFTFHSVYQIMDVAKYPWMRKERAGPKEVIEVKDDVEIKEEISEAAPGVAEAAGPKKKSTRKPRAPPVSPPKWWTCVEGGPLTPSRPTTEQLWLATKGDPSKLFTSVSLAYNVVNCPELGTKSRLKKAVESDKWDTERPEMFMDNVTRHLTPDARLLNVFASSMNPSVDCWGPCVPGGYLSSFKKNAGIVGVVNRVLRSMKKTQLHELCSKLPKVIKKEASLEDISATWAPVISSVKEMAVTPAYDVADEESSVKTWVLKLVLSLSKKTMSEFSTLHAKKKKRRTNVKADPDRPRYGIASKSVVSKELADFLGLKEGEMIARTKVVSAVNDYIEDKGLKGSKDKSHIVPDEKLSTILVAPENFGPITFFNWCNLLSPHFPKSKKALKAEAEALGANDSEVKKRPAGSACAESAAPKKACK